MSEEKIDLKNVRIMYNQEVTINLGDYQNMKPFYSVSADVEDGVNPADAFRKIRGLVERLLEEEIAAVRADKLNG